MTREEVLDQLMAQLRAVPEDARIDVSIQYVPLRFVRSTDEWKIINPETDEAFITAKRTIGGKVSLTLFVK